MKFWFATLLALVLGVSGCASKKPVPVKAAPTPQSPAKSSPPPETSPVGREEATAATPKLIVTSENMLVGTVATFNTAGRFVVLDFPVGKLPAIEQTLFIYRQGLKVGEAKVTGPERDHNTVADLISGEARKGDEVRDR